MPYTYCGHSFIAQNIRSSSGKSAAHSTLTCYK
ncbi:zinc-finger domain-containing protein [Sagittula sp. NFXS13]